MSVEVEAVYASRSCVVTGGAGFIGSHVVEALVRAGARVVAVDDLSVGRPENLAGGATLVQADVRDEAALRAAFEGADFVFHLAVACLRLSFRDPEHVHDVNATGTLRALRAARAARARRFVYVSSSEVYGSARGLLREEGTLAPTTVYGASKAAGELYAIGFSTSEGLPVTIVRPFNTYGPRSHAAGASGEVIPRFAACVLAGERPLIFGDGSQTRDFTYVDDTARGIVLAGAAPQAVGATINLARGRAVSVATVGRLVARACGRPELEPSLGPARPADVISQHAAVDRARELLGYEAAIDIEDGLARYVSWVRERGVEVSPAEARTPNW
jgi:UDP-glucose 4-epimerase